MIVSHSHKFIFIKTRKTASTSLEVFLHPNLTSRDIWTSSSTPYIRGNKDWSLWPFDVAAAKSARLRNLMGKESRLYWRYFHDHAGIESIRRGLPRRVVNDYFKFCFDRNPWDFVVSFYFQKTRKPGREMDFDAFVHTYPIDVNWNQYTIDGRVAVDAVYRYEDLNIRLPEIVERLGLKPGDLPRYKSDRRPRRPYREWYTSATRDRVAEKFKHMIDYFGYEF